MNSDFATATALMYVVGGLMAIALLLLLIAVKLDNLKKPPIGK